jgi:outer membrane protein
MRKTKLLKLLILGIAILILIAGCTSPQKIAVVDMKKIIETSEQVQNYQKNLDEKLRELQSDYESNVQDIKDRENLEEKRQTAYEKSQEIKTEMEVKLKSFIQEAIDKVAKEESIDVVLRKSDIKYGGVDITDKVIESMKSKE